MATTKTRDELVQMAAGVLQVVGSGQSLEDEDRDTIDRHVDGLFVELSKRCVCVVADDQEIPIEWCSALAELLASEASPEFGRQKLAPAARTEVEDRLKVMIQRVPAPREFLRTDLPKGGARYTLTRWTNGR